jgi:hypothetical protein
MDKELSDKYHNMKVESNQLLKQKNELLVKINDLLIYQIRDLEAMNLELEKRIKAIEKLSET